MAKVSSRFNFFSESKSNDDRVDQFFSGLWMITLGLIFLLNTSGVLPWSIWVYVFIFFAKWWPLLLIAGGLSIILDGQRWSKWIIGLIWYLALVSTLVMGFRNSPELDKKINFDNLPDSIIDVVIEESGK